MSLRDLLTTHKVVICVGSGGVGKTTTAAALASYAAAQGRTVLCLTIDPAKRLANSLGLERFHEGEQAVPKALFAKYGIECRGTLYAMMLDTKRTFDDLVTRHASSQQVRDRILGNRLYRYISTSLAGTQEYMAMEKLHSVRQDPRFDLVVLDTPPTSNALDFLDAPERMIGAIDSPAMRWFLDAFEGTGRLTGVVGRGAAVILRGVSKFTGVEFLEQVAELVGDLNDLFGGFRERAAQVSQALRGPEVAFVIVTSPDPLAIVEARFFDGRLREAGMTSHAVVVNGMHALIEEPSAPTATLVSAAAAALPEGFDAKRVVSRLRRALDDERMRGVADRIEADLLRAKLDQQTHFVEVPALEEDVHDLGGLARIASYLTASPVEASS